VGALRSGVLGWGVFEELALRADPTSVDPSFSQTNQTPSDNAGGLRDGTLTVRWPERLREEPNLQLRARQLDTAVRSEAIAGVWQHNTRDTFANAEPSAKVIAGVLDALFLKNIAPQILSREYGQLAIALGERAFWVGAMFRVALAARTGNDPRGLVTDTFLLSMRPTRAALAAGTLAMHQLVRAI